MEEALKRKASSETTPCLEQWECDFSFLSNVRFGIKFWCDMGIWAV